MRGKSTLSTGDNHCTAVPAITSSGISTCSLFLQKKKALVFSLLLAFQKMALLSSMASLSTETLWVLLFSSPFLPPCEEVSLPTDTVPVGVPHFSVSGSNFSLFFFFFLSPYLLDGWSPLDVYGGNNTVHIIFLFLDVSWCFTNIWAGVFRSLKTIQAN